MAFSPDGTLLATADGDGYVQLWNTATASVGQPIAACTRLLEGVAAVAFSPNGKLLATAHNDGYVQLWNPATGQFVSKIPLAARGVFPPLWWMRWRSARTENC